MHRLNNSPRLKIRLDRLKAANATIRPLSLLFSGPTAMVPNIPGYRRGVGNFWVNFNDRVVYCIGVVPCHHCMRRGFPCLFEVEHVKKAAQPMIGCLGCRWLERAQTPCSHTEEENIGLRPFQYVAEAATFAPIEHNRPFIPPADINSKTTCQHFAFLT